MKVVLCAGLGSGGGKVKAEYSCKGGKNDGVSTFCYVSGRWKTLVRHCFECDTTLTVIKKGIPRKNES